MGEEVQNGFHQLIHDTTAKGWHQQLPNQPTVELTAERTWRLPLGQLGGLETDALPSLTGAAGTFRTYAQAGGSCGSDRASTPISAPRGSGRA